MRINTTYATNNRTNSKTTSEKGNMQSKGMHVTLGRVALSGMVVGDMESSCAIQGEKFSGGRRFKGQHD